MHYLLLFSLIIPLISHADILFIDLNDAPMEIIAAEKAAKARGEKVIVIPPRLSDSEVAAAKKTPKYLKLTKELKRLDAIKVKSETDETAAYVTKQELLKLVRPSALNNFADSIEGYLSDLKDKNVNLSSVVISGHDGNANFGGTLGYLKEDQLKAAFKKNKPLGNNVRSILLWGCYTTTIDAAMNVWNKTLPKVELIGGFDGKAPFSHVKSGQDYLEDLLVQEQALTKIKDINDLQATFKSLKSVNVLPAAICTNDNFVTNTEKITRDEVRLSCPEERIEPIIEKINCYIKALPGCDVIPVDTKQSDLRKLYTEIQLTAHCQKYYGGRYYPNTEKILSLIHYKNVIGNIDRNENTAFAVFNQECDKLDVPDELRIIDITDFDRSQMITKLNNLASYIAAKRKDSPDRETRNKFKKLDEGFAVLQTMVGEFNQDYIPFSWIEKEVDQNRVTQRSTDNDKDSADKSKFSASKKMLEIYGY